MYIAIPFEGRVRTLIRSSFLAAKRTDATHYSLTGESFQMSGVTAEQVILLPDSVEVSEGQEVTDELLMQALPVESFITVSADEALPNVLGLLLRQAVADGRISDAELLSVQPVLEGRIWRAGIAVQVGRRVHLQRRALALHPAAHHAGRLGARPDPGTLAQGGDHRRR